MRLVSRVDAVMQTVRAAQLAALDEVAERMATEAAHRAPVRTGELRDSIHAVKAEASGRGYVAGLEAGAPYSIFVEIGTSRMSAEPFLRPAFDIYASTLADTIKGHMP